MNSNLTLWDPPVTVRIEKSSEPNRVAVSFGDWPGHAHNTWFLKEADLDTLIQNLLDAKLAYIGEKKG